MIKLVALDLDDTLLQPDGTISESSRRALQQIIEKGVLVTIATGRMYSSAVQFAKDLKLDVPLITYQGALIKTVESELVLRSLELEPDDAKQVLLFLESTPVHINLYVGDELWVKEMNDVASTYASFVNVPVKEVGRLSQLPLDGVVKIVAISDVAYIQNELLAEARELFGQRLTVNTSRPHFLEIGHQQAKKSCALAFLGAKYGIARDEMLAIGDGQNDLDMIDYAGIGVAMGNADLEVLAIADYITTSNAEEGVARALDKLIINCPG